MSYEEKVTWVSAVVTLLVVGVYAWVVGGRLAVAPVEAVAYQRALIVAVGATIALTIVGTIAMSIATAIGAEIASKGSSAHLDRTDERDAHIEARGDRAAFHVTSALMIGVLAMAMLEVPHFWIANGVFAAFVVGGLTNSAVKIAIYRRGF